VRQKANSETKVVPFRGEMYQETSPSTPPLPQQSFNFAAVATVAACLIGVGAALGATATYNSTEQNQLRQLQQESKQLLQIKQQVCK
jgi:hypothetical protein